MPCKEAQRVGVPGALRMVSRAAKSMAIEATTFLFSKGR